MDGSTAIPFVIRLKIRQQVAVEKETFLTFIFEIHI